MRELEPYDPLQSRDDAAPSIDTETACDEVAAGRASVAVKEKHRARPLEIVLIAVCLAVLVGFTGMMFAVYAALSSFTSLFASSSRNVNPPSGTYSVVRIVGTIQNTSSASLSSYSYYHNDTLNYIKQLTKDEGNEGILLYMNTAGGGVYESDEIYRALEAYKAETGRPIWAYMAQNCASGGYYITTIADHIVANYNTTTGSIGVYITLTDTSELYDNIGIETVLIRSGENKGVGTAGVPITDEQREVYQSIVDESYERFVDLVVEGRGLDRNTVYTIADGRAYTGPQALALGLVDELGDWDDTQAAFNELTGATAFTPSFSQTSTLGALLAEVEELLPRSDTEAALDAAEELPTGVPMAHAAGLG